ncbi:HORMA domain-containing protein, partial [Haematococcus lacustris]
AAAQAQAVRQATISHTESLELSIFHISYLRGLFPDDYFNGVDMRNLDGMNIKMLQPKCEESRRLIDWVESGVYDAVRRGYIKTLYFGIATDPEGVRLLEEYVFNFSYGQGPNGAVTMDVAQHNMRTGAKSHINPAQGQKSGTDTVQAVKYQVTRLMRMLVQVCQTLDRVPQERFLFMRLTYHDNTPEEYEPPFFVPVEGAGEQGSGWGGYFARKPFTMVVGDVSTSHHGVTMKVKSTLDCCDEEGEEEGMHEPAQEEVADGGGDATSQGGRTSCHNPAAKGCPGGKGDTASMVTDAGVGSKDVHEVQGKLRATAKQDTVKPAAVKTTSKAHTGTEPATVPTSLDVDPAQYKAVGMYVVQCFQNFSQLDLSDAMVAFTHIPMPQLEAIFERMEREDILTRQDVDAQAFRPGPKLLAGVSTVAVLL